MDKKNIPPLKDDALEQVSGGIDYEYGEEYPWPLTSWEELQNYSDNDTCASNLRNFKHVFHPATAYIQMNNGSPSDAYTKFVCDFCKQTWYVK